MDPIAAIGLGVGQLAGLVGGILSGQKSQDIRGQRMGYQMTQPRDYSQLYILGGIGLLILVLVLVLT
jgi:hypothetical protein